MLQSQAVLLDSCAHNVQVLAHCQACMLQSYAVFGNNCQADLDLVGQAGAFKQVRILGNHFAQLLGVLVLWKFFDKPHRTYVIFYGSVDHIVVTVSSMFEH